MSAPYRVRRALDADLPALKPMWRRLVDFEASLSPRFRVKDDAESLWLEELAADREAARADVFVAEDATGALVASRSRGEGQDDRGERKPIVGFLHVRATRGAPFHAEDRIGFVDGVWVEPAHRRRGISKLLLEEGERWCRARRLAVLEAGVVIANAEAVAAWKKLGFEMTAATMTRPLRAARGPSADAEAPRVATSPYFTFEKRVRRFVEFAKPEPTHRVLDVGCGPGVLLAALADRAGGRVGCDVSLEAARRARGSGAEVVLAAAEHLPFRDGAFHRVLSRGTLHHFSRPESAIAEAARVAAADGAVVIEDLVASEDAAKAKRQNELERLREPTHRRTLARGEIAGLLAKSGLAVDDTLAVQETRELEGWLAATADPVADELRALARGYAERQDEDPTGLLFRVVGGEVRFDHTHLLVRAVKPSA